MKVVAGTIKRLGLLLNGLLLLSMSSCAHMHLIQAANAKPDTAAVRNIKARLHKGEYVVTGAHMLRKHVPVGDVWGYQLDNGTIYRLYDGVAYQVVQTRPLIIYELEEWVGDTRWLTYRFSFQPDGKLYDLDKKTCLAVFRLDECVTGYLTNMPGRLISEPDRHGSFGLANVYAYCHGEKGIHKTLTAQDGQ